MSHITDLLLFASGVEEAAVARVNAWCVEADPRAQRFERLGTEAAGGNKVFTSEVWAMSGNYFPWEQLVKALPTFEWTYPDNVALIVRSASLDVTEVHRVNV